jgi:hypothetical protein
MLRDELLRLLVMLPADAEVVIDIGRIQVEVVDIAGVRYRGEREVIALQPHPDDLRDALAAQRGAEQANPRSRNSPQPGERLVDGGLVEPGGLEVVR